MGIVIALCLKGQLMSLDMTFGPLESHWWIPEWRCNEQNFRGEDQEGAEGPLRAYSARMPQAASDLPCVGACAQALAYHPHCAGALLGFHFRFHLNKRFISKTIKWEQDSLYREAKSLIPGSLDGRKFCIPMSLLKLSVRISPRNLILTGPLLDSHVKKVGVLSVSSTCENALPGPHGGIQMPQNGSCGFVP